MTCRGRQRGQPHPAGFSRAEPQPPRPQRDDVASFQGGTHQTGWRMPDAEEMTDFVSHDRADEVVVPERGDQGVGAGLEPPRQSEGERGDARDRDHHRPCGVA